jgi:hypothetical protein
MKRAVLGLLVLAGATSAACATVTAKAAPDRPALEVPAPPARVIEPPPRPESPPEPVPDLPPPQPTSSRPPRQSPRETAKPDPKQEAAATTETPAAAVAPVAPPPQLRPANTPDPSEAQKQAQIAVDRSKQVLSTLNAKQVPRAKKAVFDDAHRMQTLAEEALKKSDFENAKKLAEKVELTARELGAR